MSYSTQVFPFLCTLEPLRNPFSMYCISPDPPSTQLPCTPWDGVGDITPWDGVGRQGKGGMWEKSIPLFPIWTTTESGSRVEESVSPSLSLGHRREASQQLLAPGSPWLLAGSKCWEEEGGRE